MIPGPMGPRDREACPVFQASMVSQVTRDHEVQEVQLVLLGHVVRKEIEGLRVSLENLDNLVCLDNLVHLVHLDRLELQEMAERMVPLALLVAEVCLVHLVLMAVQVHLAFGVRRETLERGVPLVTPGSLEDLANLVQLARLVRMVRMA